MCKNIKAPFAWVGGKSKLAKTIVELMPDHKCYVEVFGGGLSVLYAKNPCKNEVINDINSDLINLHRVIRNYPQSLSSELNSMLRSREIFKSIKRDDLKPRNKIEKAAFYFYKIALSFGAKGDVFAQPKGNRSAKNIYKDFQVYSRRLKLATIENMEFSKLIKTYDTDETLFYLDPPYVGTESYYSNTQGFGINQHELLASMLKEVKGRFILSYNDCEVIRDLYNGFNFKEVSVNYSLNAKYRRDRGELIITNY